MKFKVGQVWISRNGKLTETVIAVTGNKTHPVVTQCEEGSVCAYSADGQFLNIPSEWDLTTLAPQAVAA